MDAETLSRLRPSDDTSGAIEAALGAAQEERTTATHRTAELTIERAKLLLVGTTAAITKVETSLRDAATDLERITAIEGALAPLLEAAEEREADDARVQQVREAAAAIEKFNEWLRTEYAPLAAAIAGGIGLEKRAIALRERLRDRHTGAVPEGLPPLAIAHVGSDGRSLSFLVRLPSAAPGIEPPAWPR